MNRLTGKIRAGGPTVVSFLSGKGGVGKSVTAYNLAFQISGSGRRVLLVDADFACGNLAILANADTADGLDRFVNREQSLNDSVVRLNLNLDLLARSSRGPIENFGTAREQAEFVARLRAAASGFDLVMIDHSSGITELSAIVASGSDENVILLVPELTSIADAYGLYKYLHQVYPDINAGFLINRAESDEELSELWERLAAMAEQFLGSAPRLIGSLPEDSSVRRSVAAQRPIAELEPEAGIIQHLNKTARVWGIAVPAAAAPTLSPEINNVTATADIKE